MLIHRSLVAVMGAAAVVVAFAAACGSPYTADADPSAAADAAPGADAADDVLTIDASDAQSSGPLVLASGYTRLAAVAANDAVVYFSDQETGTVHSVAVEGSGPAVEAFQRKAVSSLALGGTVVTPTSTLFYAELGTKILGTLEGGANNEMPTRDNVGPSAIAAVSNESADVRLVVVGVGGALNTTVIQQYDGKLGFLVGSAPSPGNVFDVAVHGSKIYWTESAAASIVLGQLGDTSATVVATDEDDCQAIAADDEGVYWTRPGKNLVRWRRAEGTVTTIGPNESSPASIAADTSGVYWITRDGKLRRSSRNETPIKTVAQGFAASFGVATHIHAIALTTKYVVWITSDGKVLRAPK